MSLPQSSSAFMPGVRLKTAPQSDHRDLRDYAPRCAAQFSTAMRCLADRSRQRSTVASHGHRGVAWSGGGATAQGVAARGTVGWTNCWRTWKLLQASSSPLLLVLDGVTDPHNLGACCLRGRRCRCARSDCPERPCRGHQRHRGGGWPAARRKPCLLLHGDQPGANPERTQGTQHLRIGTSDDAPKTVYQVDPKGPVALVLGAEGDGMRQLTRKTCDELVSIPMKGAVESLNVLWPAVCLYEALRQRSL